MKTAVEIRDYLLRRLQCTLLRPSMSGGELGILNLMEYVSFIGDRSQEWQGHRKELHERKCFNAGESREDSGKCWASVESGNTKTKSPPCTP